MAVQRRKAGVPGVLRKQTDEPNREEVHNHGKRSPSSGLCVQEVPTLFIGISDHVPHGS